MTVAVYVAKLRYFPAHLFISTLLFFGLSGSAQGQFWTEDFGFDFIGNCSSQGQLADGYFSVNGEWTVANILPNNPPANRWYVSATEAGGIDPDGFNPCGLSCLDDPFLSDLTLHIGTTNPTIDVGATYSGFAVGTLYNTDARAVSPVIDCSGQFAITLDFWYVSVPNASDYCSIDYFDGVSWTELATLPTAGTCPGNVANWGDFSVALPASANNNPNVQIGFRWRNNSDGVTTSVSVGIDNVTLTAGPAPAVPTANFEVADPTSICEGNCVTFTDLTTFDPNFSTGAAQATYQWTFTGATPATSDLQNPVVCYEDPGTFSATLVVTDNIGASAPFTLSNAVTVLDCGPVVNFEASNTEPCANEQCIDFTDLSTTENPGGITSWFWTFTSASGAVTSSSLQNPTNICLNEIGFYDVTLTATDADGTESLTLTDYIEVLDCTGPEIDFSASRTVICPGECIQLTDLSTSTSPITAWNWDMPGGTPATSTEQNPEVCYAAPGSYNITLSAVDQQGPSAITKTITIIVDPCTGPPQAGIGVTDTVICTFDCVDFFDQSLGLVEEHLWIFQGVSDPDAASSTEENPSVICYDTPGTYNVTLTVSNSNNQIDSQTFVDFITVESCINAPVPRLAVSQDTICAGKCVNFMDMSTGVGINSWQWSFQGAETVSSTAQNPQNICYNTPGTYDVSLFITSASGLDSIRVFEDVVTVVATPECRPEISVSAPDTICAGDCGEFTATYVDADSVSWTFQGGTPSTSQAFQPGLICFEEVGEYLVTVQAFNESGSSQPVILQLFVGERPPLDAGPDRTINSGATLTLTAEVAGQDTLGTFLWQPFDLVDDFTAQTVVTSPPQSTQFIVYYQEEGTCTAVDTVNVQVNFVQAVGVPSAFSPNGDGANDQLQVLGQGIALMDFKIYNRYGQLVFRSQDQTQAWDGTDEGKELNPGVFVYTLEVVFAEGQREVYTGNVTLVK